MTLAQLRRKGPLFVYAGTMMYAHVIDRRDKGRRRILATRLKVDRVAGLDPLVDDLARDTNPFARLGVVNPEFDVRHRNESRSEVLETALYAILAGARAGFELNRYIRVLSAQRHRKRQQHEQRANRTEDEFHGFGSFEKSLRVKGPGTWPSFGKPHLLLFVVESKEKASPPVSGPRQWLDWKRWRTAAAACALKDRPNVPLRLPASSPRPSSRYLSIQLSPCSSAPHRRRAPSRWSRRSRCRLRRPLRSWRRGVARA